MKHEEAIAVKLSIYAQLWLLQNVCLLTYCCLFKRKCYLRDILPGRQNRVAYKEAGKGSTGFINFWFCYLRNFCQSRSPFTSDSNHTGHDGCRYQFKEDSNQYLK